MSDLEVIEVIVPAEPAANEVIVPASPAVAEVFSPQGPAGAPGTQGPQGAIGPQGFQGQGAQGSQGATGAQGVQGFQGPQGTIGPQGTTGAQGTAGNDGQDGTQGPQGAQGPVGTQGAVGAQGPQGFQGDTGAQGATGAQGTQGPQGAAGAQGTQGPAGAQGPQGTQGATGAAPAFRGAMVRKAADQTAANYTTPAAVAWDQEAYDIGGWHDNVTNNSYLTVIAGVTKIRLHGAIHASSVTVDAYHGIYFYKNGSNTYDGSSNMHSEIGAADSFISNSSPVLQVVEGDIFQMFYQSQSDTSITIDAARSHFSIEAVE